VSSAPPAPPADPPRGQRDTNKGKLINLRQIYLTLVKLTIRKLPLGGLDQGVREMLQKHWQIKQRFDAALKEKDYHEFKTMVLRGKVSHKTLAAIMGEESLLEHTRGWNPAEWNWHTLGKFAERKRGRRPHPYQREERHHPGQRDEQRAEGSRTIGQRVDRLNGLLSALAKELN